MPSVLIEAGFISHASERSYLLSENGREKVATSIYNAFKEYKRKIESKSSFNMISESKSAKSENLAISKNGNSAASQTNIYFSVQIMALKKEIEVHPDNFKGETKIFKIKSKGINRYYSGKFKSYADAEAERKRIKKKYKSAYVVAIENNQLISLKKAQGKM